MSTLALAYQAAGKRELALALLEETLQRRKAKLGPDHADTLTTMNNLAVAYWATGKRALAVPLLEEVLSRGLTPVTRYTITSPAVLRMQVERTRSEGIAMESEETRLGYMSMAVPVFGRRSALAGAMSITAPTVRMNAARFSGALRAAAAGITRTLQTMS